VSALTGGKVDKIRGTCILSFANQHLLDQTSKAEIWVVLWDNEGESKKKLGLMLAK